MNKTKWIIFIALVVLSLSACAKSVPPIEWGQITSFSMHWGDFHGGHQSFRIEYVYGQYIFNASGEMGIQLFVPYDRPIPPYEAEAVLAVLQEHSTDRWDGFTSGWCEDCTGDFSLSLTVEMASGSIIHIRVGCYEPAGFRNVFSGLSVLLHDMAERYKAEPEWGNLIDVFFSPPGFLPNSSAFSVRLRGDEVRFQRGWGDNAITGVFEPYVMQELHQLLITRDVIGWWSDTYGRNEARPPNSHQVDITLRFDNDIEFFAIRHVRERYYQRTNRNDINALLRFLENLERQAIDALPVQETVVVLTITKIRYEHFYLEDAPDPVITTQEVQIGDVITLDAFSTVTISEIDDTGVIMRFRSDGALLAQCNNRNIRTVRRPFGSTYMIFGVPLYEMPPPYDIITESDVVFWEFVFSREVVD